MVIKPWHILYSGVIYASLLLFPSHSDTSVKHKINGITLISSIYFKKFNIENMYCQLIINQKSIPYLFKDKNLSKQEIKKVKVVFLLLKIIFKYINQTYHASVLKLGTLQLLQKYEEMYKTFNYLKMYAFFSLIKLPR